MNKFGRSKLFIALCMAFALLCAFAVAGCGTKTVTLDFVTNGGTEIEAIEGKPGDAIDPPADPVRTGYIFDGWYLTSDCSGESTTIPSVLPDESKTYYAKWHEAPKASVGLVAGEGGTLSESEVEAYVGSSLSDALKDKTPQAETGLTFAGWFTKEGDEFVAVAENAVVPEDGVTLYARYTTVVTVNVYLQNTDGSYPETPSADSETVYFEDPFVFSEVPEHFSLDPEKENHDSSEKTQIGEVFNIWLSREKVYLMFETHDSSSSIKQVESLYGATVELPFVVDEGDENVRFAGWTVGGDDTLLAAGSEYHAESATLFSGVWNHAVTDLFGGSDRVFLLSEKPGYAVLVRGGMECEGVVSEDGTSVTFTISSGNTLEAHLFETGFAYLHEDFEGEFTYYDTYYDPDLGDGGRFVESIKLTLDGVHGAHFIDGEGEDMFEADGTFTFSKETGYFRFESEERAFWFMLGEVRQDGGLVPAFIIYNPLTDGDFAQFIITDFETQRGYISGVVISLDGIGGATLIEPGTYGSTKSTPGSYYLSAVAGAGEDVICIIGARFEGDETDTYFRTTMLDNGMMAYILRNDDLADTVFSGNIGGQDATLELDGFGDFSNSATLTIGDVETTSYYVELAYLRTFGGYVVSVGGHTLLIDEEAESFTEFDYNFTEYLWLMDGGIYSPIMFLYEDPVTVEGVEGAYRAEIYAANSSRQLVHAASGYYVAEKFGGIVLYSYQQTQLIDGFDGQIYDSYTFLANSLIGDTGAINVYYMLSAGEQTALLTLPEFVFSEEQPGMVEATGNLLLYNVGADPGVEGLGSLYCVNTYDDEGEVVSTVCYEGSLTAFGVDSLEGMTYFDFSGYDSALGGEFHFYFFYAALAGDTPDEEVNIVIPLDYAPLELNSIDEDGSVVDEVTMALDGMGGATWFVYEIDDSGWWTEYTLIGTVEGTVEITGTTSLGADIYTFTPEENNWDVGEKQFVIEYYEDEFWGMVTPYYLLHEKKDDGTSLSGDYGTLELDGFIYQAVYTDLDGNEMVGTYLYEETDEGYNENVIALFGNDGSSIIIDLTEDGFSVRDGYDGRWDIWSDALEDYMVPFPTESDENGQSNIVAIFDGYGNVQIERYLDSTILATGKYFIDESGDIHRLSLTWDGGSGECNFVFVSGTYDLFVVIEESSHIKTLVADTGAVFELDGYGFCNYYSEFGVEASVSARYSVLGEGAWVIIFNDEDSTSILLREKETDGVANCEIVDNSEYAATFYASDLSAIVFASSFVQLDGVTSYYAVSDDGKTATLYTPNEHGSYTVSTLEMPDGDTYDYNEKTFSRWTEAKKITLTCKDDFASGITISFTPDGTADYEVPMFFVNEEWDGLFTFVGAYDYTGKWSPEIHYDDSGDWFYITLECDLETGEGTFTFNVQKGGSLHEHTAEDGSKLVYFEGAWSDRVSFFSLTTGGDTVRAITLNGLAGLATEDEDETYGTIYEITEGEKSYRFCLEETEEGTTVLHMITD